MDHLEVRTTVRAAPDAVYALLLDVPRYAGFAEHVRSVETDGDGGSGTEYAVAVAWSRLSHTVRLRVTDVDPPARIDWRAVDGVDASGHWLVEPAAAVAEDGTAPTTRVRLHVAVAPDAADEAPIDLPRFLPMDRVVARARGAVEAEARRVLRRAVAELEGEVRPVEIAVETWTDDG